LIALLFCVQLFLLQPALPMHSFHLLLIALLLLLLLFVHPKFPVHLPNSFYGFPNAYILLLSCPLTSLFQRFDHLIPLLHLLILLFDFLMLLSFLQSLVFFSLLLAFFLPVLLCLQPIDP